LVAYIYVAKRFHFMKREVFQAIADPTRREILNMVAHKPLNVNAVAEHFDVSRTAVYKHIKMLVECGLIDMKQQGRERYCEARLEKLIEVSAWIERCRQFWETKLDSLENFMYEIQTKRNKDGNKHK